MKVSILTLQLLLSAGLAVVGTACSSSRNNGTDQMLAEIQTNDTSNQIVNGVDVIPTQPLSRNVVAIYDTLTRTVCSGALFENNIVLTAAHCIGFDPQKQFIVFKTNFNELKPENTRQVIAAVAPREWKQNEFQLKNQSDIAIMKFVGTVPAGYQANRLIPDIRYLKKGTPVVVTGYGISNLTKRSGTGVLRQALSQIADEKFSETEISVDQSHGFGACHGDSGGPAYVVVNNNYYLWGIVSRNGSDPNNQCNVLGVFTNVSIYAAWIRSAVLSLNRN